MENNCDVETLVPFNRDAIPDWRCQTSWLNAVLKTELQTSNTLLLLNRADFIQNENVDTTTTSCDLIQMNVVYLNLQNDNAIHWKCPQSIAVLSKYLINSLKGCFRADIPGKSHTHRLPINIDIFVQHTYTHTSCVLNAYAAEILKLTDT